ncbi:MAG TPA: hypothetical protein VKB94_09645 [Rhizomicrobium sp.]|nr:hypothetical protein [Rhizomicrobium sp.]
MRRYSSGYDFLFFIAILATLASLAPALAHLIEMSPKLALGRDDYFTVQKIYAGWALFGIAILAQVISLALLAWRSAREYYVFRPVVAALVLLVIAQALFWLFTFPANEVTQNWTRIPEDWEALRRQWEYSHAGGAICQLGGLCCLISALFARVRASGR